MQESTDKSTHIIRVSDGDMLNKSPEEVKMETRAIRAMNITIMSRRTPMWHTMMQNIIAFLIALFIFRGWFEKKNKKIKVLTYFNHKMK